MFWKRFPIIVHNYLQHLCNYLIFFLSIPLVGTVLYWLERVWYEYCKLSNSKKCRRKIYFEVQLPKELVSKSLEVFLVISVALWVTFSIIDAIPILSAPFQTPSKKVFQPKPIIARKSTPTTINTRIPIVQILFPLVPLTIMKGIYLFIVQKLELELAILFLY